MSQEGAQGAADPADVTWEREGDHVAVVCLHRPPNNFFDVALVEGLASAYEELAGTEVLAL